LLGRKGRGCTPRHDDIDLQIDQLGRQAREALGATIRRAIFEEQVLPFDIPKLAQPFL
jgi:hypothetical protein